jgi:hypothetical protein
MLSAAPRDSHTASSGDHRHRGVRDSDTRPSHATLGEGGQFTGTAVGAAALKSVLSSFVLCNEGHRDIGFTLLDERDDVLAPRF